MRGGMLNASLIINICYYDSDRRKNADTRESVTGHVHCLDGGEIPWASRIQRVVAQSTVQRRYDTACEACMKGKGLRNVLT